MTNEEAVAYIQEWLKDEYALNSKDRKVLNMAVKTLEQEPCEDAELDFVQPHKKIPVNLETCEDAISREDALMCLTGEFSMDEKYDPAELVSMFSKRIKKLPSVRSEQKTGHWIMIDKELQRYKCSECGEAIRLYKKSEIPKLEKDETLSNYPFSHCGCRMVEPQESEE